MKAAREIASGFLNPVYLQYTSGPLFDLYTGLPIIRPGRPQAANP